MAGENIYDLGEASTGAFDFENIDFFTSLVFTSEAYD